MYAVDKKTKIRYKLFKFLNVHRYCTFMYSVIVSFNQKKYTNLRNGAPLSTRAMLRRFHKLILTNSHSNPISWTGSTIREKLRGQRTSALQWRGFLSVLSNARQTAYVLRRLLKSYWNIWGETKSCLKEDHKRYWGNFDANVSPDLWVMGNQFVCGLCEIL